MTKTEMAESLSVALDILNDIQSGVEVDGKMKGRIHAMFSMIPERLIEESDFRNNGTIGVKRLMK